MKKQNLIRTYVSVFVFLMLGCVADVPVSDVATETPQATEQIVATTTSEPVVDTPTAPSATVTITLPTPSPTLAPNAITTQTAEEIQLIYRVEDVRFGALNAVSLAPDGTSVAVGSNDRRIRLFAVPDGSLLFELEWHDGPINTLAYSPDGSLLASGGQDRTVQLWDPNSGERIIGARTASEPAQLVFDPTGDRFSYAGLFSALGETRSAVDTSVLYQLEGHTTRLRSIAQSTDGVWIATGDREGTVVLHGAQSGQAAFTISTGITAEILSLAFSPDSKLLAVGLSTGQIQIWDVARQEQSNEWVAHSNGVRSMVYSADGSLIISGGTDAGLRLWDVASGERVASYPEHNGAVNGVSLSNDGRFLASVGQDSVLLVWGAENR